MADMQEKMQILENELTYEKKQNKNYIKQLYETKKIQKQTIAKLESMTNAMNELESMKTNYKKMLVNSH